MALFRCSSGAGSTPQETTLWTNPNPTSSYTSTAGTLSDDPSNYDEIKVKYRVSTTDATEKYVTTASTDWAVAGGRPVALLVLYSGNLYARSFYMNSSTVFNAGLAYRVNAAGNVGVAAIPLEIIGIKH